MRRGEIIGALLIFSRTGDGSSWNWHLGTEDRASAGCRGFIGPVPQPLLMRFVTSTNTDRMIYGQNSVKRDFAKDFAQGTPGKRGGCQWRVLYGVSNRAPGCASCPLIFAACRRAWICPTKF